MIKLQYLKSDIKQIYRDPIIIILYLVPLLLIIITKVGLNYLPKYTNNYFNLLIYHSYILATVLALSSGMIGIATGFMMIDDKDGKIYELMQITPIGRSGYLFHRLFLPSVASILYYIAIIYTLYPLVLKKTILLSTYEALQMTFYAIIIFHLANDKVKGLTYAKGLNIVIIFCLIDLFDNTFLITLGHFLPTYWITQLIQNDSLQIYGLSFIVHIAWFLGLLYLFYKSKQ